MADPRWEDHPIRGQVESKLGGALSDDDWHYLVEEDYLGEVERVASGPAERIDMLLREIRRLRRVGELPRSRRVRGNAYARHTVRWGLSDEEAAMAAAISDAMLLRALQLPDVHEARERLSRLGHLSESQVRADWTENPDGFTPEFRRFVIEVADYFGWDAEATAVFLILGSPQPAVEPVRAFLQVREVPDEYGNEQPRARARIILEFDPWLSKETVVDIYERLRRELIGKGSKRPTVAQLEAFRFVLPYLGPDGEPSETSWSAIGRAWNQKYEGTNWEYRKPEDIRRAYRSVRDQLINRRYEITGTAPFTPQPNGGSERGSHIRFFVDGRRRTPQDQRTRESSD